MDVLTRKQRSNNMSKIKSRENISTEISFVKLLRQKKITGWRRNFRLVGKPDIVFPKKRITIFLDGCFWHGCKYHFVRPKTNSRFWLKKITLNVERDKKTRANLKNKKWQVMRIWEHQIKENPKGLINSVQNALVQQSAP